MTSQSTAPQSPQPGRKPLPSVQGLAHLLVERPKCILRNATVGHEGQKYRLLYYVCIHYIPHYTTILFHKSIIPQRNPCAEELLQILMSRDLPYLSIDINSSMYHLESLSQNLHTNTANTSSKSLFGFMPLAHHVSPLLVT